ncbi:MAG: ExeM/NucH family extracellular endonuclease, partial [Leptolyngbya sp. SIO4C1]|nr:ExeM/NucH family extracellular endonuclease [Leptolyngbya sp. SIO4C1]
MEPDIFISEIHYDNQGTDVGEFIEITGPAGISLDGYSLVLYNGNGGTVYDTVALSGTVPDEANDQGAVTFNIAGIQNGAPDGIALVDPSGNVVEFLSYEGTLTATDGPASGQTSTDIGVAETSSTPIGQSLQLINGSWTGPDTATKGSLNTGGNGGGAEEKLISEIQGSGAESPLVGSEVTIEAVVVGDFQDGASGADGDLNGFFVQEEDADADGSAATSEGLFIFDGSSPAVDVAVGDLVQVTGTVTEFNGLTELTNVTVSQQGTAVLPTAATVSFPLSDAADLEAFEGMQITIPDTLFVTEYFNLDRFGEVVLSSDGPSNAPGTDGRLDQYTQFNAPDQAGFTAYQDAIAARRIVLDDGQTVQNPDPILLGRGGEPLSTDNTLRGGDTVNNLTGVLSYSFGDYRIQPVAPVDFQPANPRPAEPEPVGGDLKVVSFNVLNFFTTLDVAGNPGSGPNNLEPRGVDSQAEFERQLQKLVTALEIIDGDIVGLIELENEFGGDQNGDGQFAIDTLVDALNDRVGAGTYAYVEPGRTFVDVSDAISVGAIYKTTSVQLALGTTVEILDDSDLPALGLNFDNAVFDGPSTNRAALAATFEEVATGEQLTVAVNHFKSKGSVNSAPGNEAQGDGAGNNNAIRLQASQALDAWLDTDPTGSNDPDYLIIGDLNAYAQEDPITYLENEGYTNVVDNPESAYSFVFDGQFGTLDYGLANTTLISQVTGATEWHVNADEPDALDYNLDFGRDPSLFDGSMPYRNSDHDPLIIGLDLSSPNQINEIMGTNQRDLLEGTDGADRIEGRRGWDVINGGAGEDSLLGGRGADVINGGDGDDIITGGRGIDILDGGAGRDIFVYDAVNEGLDVIRN